MNFKNLIFEFLTSAIPSISGSGNFSYAKDAEVKLLWSQFQTQIKFSGAYTYVRPF